jgi:hypothetical protein
MNIDTERLKAQLSAAFEMMEVTQHLPELERPDVSIHFGAKPQATHLEYYFTLSLRDKFVQEQPMPTDMVKGFYARQVVKWVRGAMRLLDNFTPGPYNGVVTLTPQGAGFIATIAVDYYSEF